jgi:GcrA cell cycle regulator
MSEDTALSWTDERVELLRKLWSEGHSASQVAATLGGVTRNAVIGKIHRLGLSGRGKANTPIPTARPRPAKVRKVEEETSSSVVVMTAPVSAPDLEVHSAKPSPSEVLNVAPEDALPDSSSDYVTIMDLRDSMCRWPIGDPTSPDFRYCGARCSPGSPYCTHHARIAYQPSAERRREKRIVNG